MNVTFIPVTEDRLKTRKMKHPLDVSKTKETLQFLIKDGQPANFKVMMTNKCNLSCSYCFQQHDKELILWTDETLDHFFDAMLELDTSHCWNTEKLWDWFGGEPLIYKNVIIDFMRRNRDKINSVEDMRFSLTTNSTLLDEEFIDEFLDFNGTYIIVSFDSFFLEHDLRNHTTETAQEVLRTLNKIANKAGPYNTSVTMTANPRLLTTFRGTLELLYRSGVRNFLVNPLIYNKTVMEDWNTEKLKELTYLVVSFAEEHKDAIIEFGAEVAPKYTTNCLTGGKNFAVDGSGDVSGCFFFSNDKKKHGDIMLANIFSGLVNDDYDLLAAEDTVFYKTEEKCQTCDVQDLCYVCPAGVKDVTGNKYFASNTTCQDMLHLHLEVAEVMSTQNQPYRQKVIDEFNKI